MAETRPPYPVHAEIRARFNELDGLGHVNNAVFFTYMEIAREFYWQALGYSMEMAEHGFLLARAECDFRAPILFGATVRVMLRCPRVGTKSWEYEYRLEDRDRGTLFAEARSVQVYYHFPSRTAQPLSPELRAAIARLEGWS
jgi:acyl-CoA thioester hydrolase